MFDTELAARLLGMHRVGLGTVVEDTLGIQLAKAHSASDWSTRPLPQSWLEYAALDVEHLVDAGRDPTRSSTRPARPSSPARSSGRPGRATKPSRGEPWRRLSGLHTVRGRRNLAVARALWLTREELAREQDVAPGRLVPDALCGGGVAMTGSRSTSSPP